MKIAIRKAGKLASGERRLLATCVLALVALAILGGFVSLRYLPPEPPPALQKFPIPNAYDTLMAVHKLYVPMPTPAIDEAGDYGPGVVRVNGHVINKVYPPSPRDAWLKRNAGALALLRLALTQKYLQPASDYTSARERRDLAWLLVVEAHARAQRNDWCAAADSGLDDIALGTKITAGAVEIGELDAQHMDALGGKVIWEALPHLSSTKIERMLLRLKQLQAARAPLRQMLLEQKAMYHQTLFDWLRGNPPSAAEMVNVPDNSTERLLWKFANYRTILKDEDNFWDGAIALADRPYQLRKLTDPGISLSDPIVYFMHPFGRQFFFEARHDSSRILLLTSVARRVFKIQHGRYPNTLSELTPNILKTVPRDPFGSGGALVYRCKGTNCLLYSVGPDGRDDGGRPIDHPGHKSGGYYVQEEDKGDMVAGIDR